MAMSEEYRKQLEKALKAFWLDNGKHITVNAEHTIVNVEPKYLIGDRINPEIAKKIISVYLSMLTSDRIVSEDVVIDNEGMKIFDKGELVVDIVNDRFVDSIANDVTTRLGKELSKKEKKSGGSYVTSKEKYTFGEIKQALAEFLIDSEKRDSKNILKDAVLLLVK